MAAAGSAVAVAGRARGGGGGDVGIRPTVAREPGELVIPGTRPAFVLPAQLELALAAAEAGAQNDRLERPAPKGRVVAIGDLHGDPAAMLAAFRLAGAVDASGRWCGGQLTVVQMGDNLDRGEGELEVVLTLDRLQREAAAAGGAVHVILGNHEVLNTLLDFRFIPSMESLRAWAKVPQFNQHAAVVGERLERLGLPHVALGRAAALIPGGPLARVLAARPAAIRVGGTLFVHGGLPPHPWSTVARLESLNRQARLLLQGRLPPEVRQNMSAMEELFGEGSPFWTRRQSEAEDEALCADLAASLKLVGAERLVVGHTIQEMGAAAPRHALRAGRLTAPLCCRDQLHLRRRGVAGGCGSVARLRRLDHRRGAGAAD